jgi:alcohol dehydrogenase class IV
MAFEFATAGRIVFGSGKSAGLPAFVREIGEPVLLVSSGRAAGLARALADTGIAVDQFTVRGEPTVDAVRDGARAARSGARAIVAVGGGSAIDAAKAIAALAANPGDVLDYLEVVGRGQPLTAPPLPVIAVPTTAGTGAEVTRNAVIESPPHRVKASIRDVRMIPRIALIDPELTYDLPPGITASTGLDALTQLIEPYVSSRANAMVDLFCLEGIRRVARSLRRAFTEGRNREARLDMSMAALLGGLSLANAGLGVVHGFAAPIGGMFDAPHGAVCAAVLPHAMAANIQALRRRHPDHPAVARYAAIARALTGDPSATPEDGAGWTAGLCRDLRISSLRAFGIQPADLPEIVQKAANASSMKANPIELTHAELMTIVERAL